MSISASCSMLYAPLSLEEPLHRTLRDACLPFHALVLTQIAFCQNSIYSMYPASVFIAVICHSHLDLTTSRQRSDHVSPLWLEHRSLSPFAQLLSVPWRTVLPLSLGGNRRCAQWHPFHCCKRRVYLNGLAIRGCFHILERQRPCACMRQTRSNLTLIPPP